VWLVFVCNILRLLTVIFQRGVYFISNFTNFIRLRLEHVTMRAGD